MEGDKNPVQRILETLQKGDLSEVEFDNLQQAMSQLSPEQKIELQELVGDKRTRFNQLLERQDDEKSGNIGEHVPAPGPWAKDVAKRIEDYDKKNNN